MSSFETPKKKTRKDEKKKDELTVTFKKQPKRSSYEEPTESVEYKMFKTKLDDGEFEATDEDVKKILLIPHFDPPELEFNTEDVSFVRPLKRKTKKPEFLSNEQFYDIHTKSKAKALKIYEKRMSKYYSPKEERLPLSKDESSDSNMHFNNTTREKMQESIIQLRNQVVSIQQQNEALAAHLILLEKAKQQLELKKECLIRSMDWMKDEISLKKKRQKKKKILL